MKTLLLSICAVLISLGTSSNALADETLLFTGKCRNVTHALDGLLKLCVIEKTDGSLVGYMSISGWLTGSGELSGIRRGNQYEFKTVDGNLGVAIRWEGVKKEGKVSGEYYIDPNAEMGLDKQEGEWEAISLSSNDTSQIATEETFKSRFMLMLETELNAPVNMADGTTQSGANALFSTVHPAGTGVSVCVDDVIFDWKEGAAKNSVNDIRRYTVDYTLYWHGLLQANGHTKLRMTYNANLGKVTTHDLVSTTGTTNQDVKKITFDIGVLLGAALVESLLQPE